MYKHLSMLLLLLQTAAGPVGCNAIDKNGSINVGALAHTEKEADETTNFIPSPVYIMGKRNRRKRNRILAVEAVSVCQRIDSTKYTTIRVAGFKVDSLVKQKNDYKIGSCTKDCMLICHQYDSYTVQKDDCLCSGIVRNARTAKTPNILQIRLGEKIEKIIESEKFDNRFTIPKAQPSPAPSNMMNGGGNDNGNMNNNNNNNNSGGNNGGGNMNMNNNNNGGGNGNMNNNNGNGNGNMNNNNGGGNMNMNNNNNGGGNGNMNNNNGNGNGNMNNHNGGGNMNMNGNGGGGNGNGNGNNNMNKMNSGDNNGDGNMMKPRTPTTARPVSRAPSRERIFFNNDDRNMMKPRTPTTARPVSRAPSREIIYFPDGPNGKNKNDYKPPSLEEAIIDIRSPASSPAARADSLFQM
jgi:hypothetical protein